MPGSVVVTALVLAVTPVLRNEASWWAIGLVAGLAAQVVKVCTDALVQQHVDDDFRGRVFSVYDLAFNAAVTTTKTRHKYTRPYRPQTNGKVCEDLPRRCTGPV